NGDDVATGARPVGALCKGISALPPVSVTGAGLVGESWRYRHAGWQSAECDCRRGAGLGFQRLAAGRHARIRDAVSAGVAGVVLWYSPGGECAACYGWFSHAVSRITGSLVSARDRKSVV